LGVLSLTEFTDFTEDFLRTSWGVGSFISHRFSQMDRG